MLSHPPLKLFFPQENGTYADTTLILKWKKLDNAINYDIEIAQDINFSSLFFSSTVSTNVDTVDNITSGLYYWRCIANMSSSQTITSSVNSFRVVSLDSLSALKLWWDASDGIVKDGSNKISQWADKSGNGNNGIQADGLKQPVFQDSVINNYPMVKFDGLTQAIKTNPFTLSPPAQVFMIYNKSTNGSNSYIFDGGDLNRFRLSLTGSNTYLLYAGNFFETTGNAGALGNKILTVKQGLSQSMIRSNMTSIGTGNPGSSVIDGFVLGEYGLPTTDPNVHSEIDVAEVLIYSDTLSAQRTLDIENYLRYKYAPPVYINATELNYFCPATLYPQKDYTTYLWNTGATTKTIEVLNSGTYYLTVQDNFGFSSSDTINLIINKPSYPQLSDSVLCIGNTIKWDIGLPKNTYTFQWPDNSTDSVLSINTAGQYWVKITDSLGCFQYSDTILVTVDNFSSIVTLGNDTSLCSGNSLYLKAGAGQATSYLWNDNSTNDSLIITATGQYRVTVNNVNSCSKTDTINITIAGSAPTANFSNTITCFGNATTFTDLSIPPGGDTITDWLWDFGEPASGLNDTSTLQNPIHVYADTGSYTVKIIVTTNAGCANEIIKIIRVYPKPTPNFKGVMCQDSSSNFSDLSILYGYPINTWSWNFGDPSSGINNTSNLQNPSHNYNVNGSYAVKLIIENNMGCIDSVVKNIVADPAFIEFQIPLKLFFPQDGGTYANSSVVFNWNNVNNLTSYTIEIANNINFSPIAYSLLNYTNKDTILNMPAGSYYWRCVANLNCSQTITSGVNSFRVITVDSLSSLKLWWDASDGIVKDGSNKISQWVDKSGNGNDGLQADGTKQPVLQDSVINNYPVVKFDGLTHAIKSNPFTLSPPAQLFMIYTKSTNGFNSYIFDGGDINRFRLSLTGSNTYLLYAGSFFETTDNAGALGNKILTVKQGLSQSMIRSNMTSIGTGDPGSSVIDGFVLGEYGTPTTDPNVHAEIDVAEVLIYSDTLSSQRTLEIESYLRYKYAPPVFINATELNYFCPTTLFPQKDYNSYLWNTGATTKTIDVLNSGTYYLTVQDNFGFSSSDTIDVLINRPTYPQLTDSVLCVGNTIKWDIGLAKNTYTFQWQDNSTDSVFSITTAGQYWVKITDSLGCFQYSDTITTTVDNFPFIASLGNDTSLCSGNSIYLKTGASQAINYLWNDNSTNDSLTVTATGQYWVTVSNVNSCSKTDTINITIAGNAPTAGFSSTNVCFGDSTTFTDMSTPPGGDTITDWLWDFGDLITSTAQNPSHVYADTGSYTVTLLVKTNAGCGAEYSKMVNVYPHPQISFTSSNLCNNEGTQFSGGAITFGYPIAQWDWDFGDPSSGVNNLSSLQNPVHAFANVATYTVQLIAENGYGCADTVTQNIIINQPPVADFSYSLACKNSSVQFTDNTILPTATTIQSSSWNFGDNGVSSLVNPKHTFSANVNYMVTHIVIASNGCADTAVKTVSVYPEPYAYFSSGNTCENTLIEFTDMSVVLGGTVTGWLWNFGSGNTSVLQNASHLFAGSGNKNVKLTVTSAQGCKDSITKTIVVHPLPVADFTFTPSVGTTPVTVNFNNTSTGALTYVWDFGDQNQSTMVNPSHNYVSAGSYQVLLTARNSFGCENTKVKPFEVFVPYLDVALLDVITTLQNDFLNITVKVANTGNVDVTSMEFYVNVQNGPMLKENWTGLLQSAIMSYDLNSSVYLGDKKEYVCVSVFKPNGTEDAVAENNELCRALDESEFKVLDIYPNPSIDLITIPFIIPAEKLVTITIYDVNGAEVRNAYAGYLSNGLQMVVINTMELTSGLYACKINYENQTVIKTFIKH